MMEEWVGGWVDGLVLRGWIWKRPRGWIDARVRHEEDTSMGRGGAWVVGRRARAMS